MNQAVLITGAQSGTGYGIAERFAREGWTVLISGQNRDEACAAAECLAEKYGIVAKGQDTADWRLLPLRCVYRRREG